MENLFDNITFGQHFVTRGGLDAVFLHKVGDDFYRFGTHLETFTVHKNGFYHADALDEDCLDIVSRKEIDVKAVDKKAEEYCEDPKRIINYDKEGYMNTAFNSFWAGYKTAKKETNDDYSTYKI